MNGRTRVVAFVAALIGMASLAGAGWPATLTLPADGSAYSAPALYNLGNFYARAERPAMAVLNYERALILSPTDSDIQKNLSHVRESVGLPALHAGWLSQHGRVADPNTLYWIGILGLAISGITLLLRRASAHHRLVLTAGAIIGGLLIALSLGDAIATSETLHEYVVMAATPARTSPTSVVEPLFTAPLADVVSVREEHQGFALIRDTQGREGWVARRDLAPVIPDNSTAART